MSNRLRCISPIDSQLYVERPLTQAGQASAAVDRARRAAAGWAATPLAERVRLVSSAVDAFVAKGSEIAEEITRQMGRPDRADARARSGRIRGACAPHAGDRR